MAYGVGFLNDHAGLEGFRWLFIIEGLITVVSIIPLLFLLPDWPAKARFLSEDDKKFMEDRVAVQGGGYTKRHSTREEIITTIASPRMLAHYLAYFCDCIPLGSLTFFTPTIVAGLGYESVFAQLMTVPPWVLGYFVSLFLGWSADRFNARGYHVFVANTIGGIGWLAAGLLPTTSYTARYGMLFLDCPRPQADLLLSSHTAKGGKIQHPLRQELSVGRHHNQVGGEGQQQIIEGVVPQGGGLKDRQAALLRVDLDRGRRQRVAPPFGLVGLGDRADDVLARFAQRAQ